MNNTVLGRIFLGIVLIVIVVVTVIQLANLIGGDDSPDPIDEPVITQEILPLSEYDTDSSTVRYTIDGSVVGREDHNAVRISISSTQRKIQVFEGYDGKVIDSKTYKNDMQAYRVFLRSLDYEGFDNSKEGTAGDDERGICPSSRRYIYELLDSNVEVFRNWRAGCSKAAGTFAGDASAVKNLFRKQIPDYSDMVRGLSLR